MARKNIFQLVEESYDIQDEIRKIDNLFSDAPYFSANFSTCTFEEVVENYLLSKWKYRGTCLDIGEFFKRVDAVIPKMNRIKESQIINNLEVMENFIKLYFDNSDVLYEEEKIQYYETLESEFHQLIKTLEKKMGLTKREYKDRVILYPKNAPLEKVVSLFEGDEDVQWELIRYVREDLSLTEKRKTLAYLATNLYIEQDENEKNEHIKELVKIASNILNNLHIRHNNKTGKWENKVLEDLDEADALSLCDMVYNEMLTIVLLREHKEYEKVYKEFNKKQKEARVKE